VAISCGHGNETSGPIESWEYFNQLSNYQSLKNASVPRNLIPGFTLLLRPTTHSTFPHIKVDSSEGAGGRIILKLNLNIQDGRLWAGLIWLRIGTCGGLLRTR
jgi:hypothetical protein